MMEFFPAFASYVQGLTTEVLRIGELRDPVDSDLADGLSISVYRVSEEEAIQNQGFKNQYRLRVNFVYNIVIFSRNDEAQCNEYSTLFLSSLKPGTDVHITDYNSNSYSMYLNPIKDNIIYKQETNFWMETLTFSGFVYSKII